MIIVKVYKYDSAQEANGYRGTDYSAHLLQGNEFTEDITQELDTCEITLSGLNFEKEFDPQTKFIIDYYQDSEANPMTRHWLVAKDMVQKPILSDDNYFDHHISLIEPSVVAQQRLVDNISATYKLKDVNLEVQTTLNLAKQAITTFQNYSSVSRDFGNRHYLSVVWQDSYCWGKHFELSDNIKVVLAGNETTDYYIDVQNYSSVKFIIPEMKIYGGIAGSKNFNFIGKASIDYLIEEFPTNKENEVTRKWSGEIIENTPLQYNNYYIPMGAYLNGITNVYDIRDEWMVENVERVARQNASPAPVYYYKKYVDKNAPAPSYETQTINILQGYSYKISIFLHEFPDDLQIANPNYNKKFNGATPIKQAFLNIYGSNLTTINANKVENYYLTPIECSASSIYCAYDGTIPEEILFASGIPYSALTLLQKAIINSSIYEKQDDIYIADINNSNTPFYIDENYIDKLSATQIIENFYSQKNLWEIMIEVGHYIHAIPELKFGADDKFIITFNELGRTDQKEDFGTKVSIFNSRGVEDYISSTSSYISNMVQLGGVIEEWIVPKTSSEDFLVYNDTAELQTTKSIIELLHLTVKCNNTYSTEQGTITAGETADLTPFIYEENVYNLLDILENIVPNKGIAMYYKLGTNKITGGNYQLPRVNPDIYADYAFKKIIWCAFKSYPSGYVGATTGFWKNLNINDFSFFIAYRTKDDVRQTHTRQDLRKYLLNSKYDRYPQHNQFNNQTDTLVDSVKFGNNMFGKLIKTGNTSYEITEWHSNIYEIKKKGELYRIGDDLYYVAKVKHIWFHSYILSQVTFSKDYNELSAVIGIPSEPRFYEIGEQSLIEREVAINDLILVTDAWEVSIIDFMSTNSFLHTYDHLKNLMFGEGTEFAKYALTVYKGDKDAGTVMGAVGQADFYKEILSPLNAYSSGNTLTYEWDMIDNYSAGDKIINTITPQSAEEGSYKSLLGVGYTDIYGKADLMDFYILKDNLDLSQDPDQIRALPESPIRTTVNYIATITETVSQTRAITPPTPTYPPYPEYNTQLLDDYIQTNLGRTRRIGDTFVIRWQGNFDDNNIIVTDPIDIYTYYRNGWAREKNVSEANATQVENIALDTRPSIWEYDVLATNVQTPNTDYHSYGIGLLKDCREKISINYNLQLVTSSDTFVVSPFIFSPNKVNLKMVVLNKEVNKLSDGFIDSSTIIKELYDTNNNLLQDYMFNVEFSSLVYPQSITPVTLGQFLISTSALMQLNNKHFTGEDNYERIKSIAIICDLGESYGTTIPNVFYKSRFVLARNIPEDWTKFRALQEWCFGNPKKNELFKNKQ